MTVASAVVVKKLDAARLDDLMAVLGGPTQSWHTFATFNYHGPLSMYEKAGFTKLREGDGWAVLRKEL